MPAMITELTGLGEAVALRDVERRLRMLWDTDTGMTRASAMNFAVVCEGGGSLERNTEIMREMTREHACRALLLATEKDAADEPQAWITAHCQLAPGGKKHVCSEQVAILLPGHDPLALTNTLLTNLDSDLPLTLWWQGDFSSLWTAPLYTCIDRLVIDSAEWSDPAPQLALVENAWRDPASAFSVNDLSWTRVLPLRLALASAFDEPAALAGLRSISEMEIHYATGHRLAASMFAAWVMHQAGWALTDEKSGPGYLMRTGSGGTVRLQLRESDSDCPVPLVRLNGPGLAVEVEHPAGSPFILSRVQTSTPMTERLTPCTSGSAAQLIIERLRRGCNTRFYFSLLPAVRRLLVA